VSGLANGGRVRFAGQLVLLVAVLLGGCHYALPAGLSEEEQPLWTEADLPPLPPDADNGWVVFGEGIGTLSRMSSLPSDLSYLVHPDDVEFAEVTWADARDLGQEIDSFLGEESNLTCARFMLHAMAKPRFADACGISSEARCPAIEMLESHRGATLIEIHAALWGFWDEAAMGTSRMLRQSFDLVVSSRRPSTRAVSLIMGRMPIALAGTLLAGWEEDTGGGHRDPDVRRALAGLCAEVEAFDPRDIDPWQPMIGEYLGFLEVADMAAPRSDDGGIVDLVFYDRDSTLHVLNECFKALREFAKNPLVADLPSSPDSTERWGWWLYNPVGKKVLSGDWWWALTSMLETHENRRRELAATRDDVLGRCEGLGLLASPLTVSPAEP